jgi:hypothetical protein
METIDICAFWKELQKQKEFCCFALLARKLLEIPASGAAVKRVDFIGFINAQTSKSHGR